MGFYGKLPLVVWEAIAALIFIGFIVFIFWMDKRKLKAEESGQDIKASSLISYDGTGGGAIGDKFSGDKVYGEKIVVEKNDKPKLPGIEFYPR
jgi:hypothetical protein